MRPNADIPQSVNAEAKEYAEATDQTLEEAWRDIIESGLRSLRPFSSGELELEPPERLSLASAPLDPGTDGSFLPLFSPIPRGFRSGDSLYVADLLRSESMYLEEFESEAVSPIVEALGRKVLDEAIFSFRESQSLRFGRGLRSLFFALREVVDGGEREDFDLPGGMVHFSSGLMFALTFREAIPGERFEDLRGISLRVFSPGIPYSNRELDGLTEALDVEPSFREVGVSVERSGMFHSGEELRGVEPIDLGEGLVMGENPFAGEPGLLGEFLERDGVENGWFSRLKQIPVRVGGSTAYLVEGDLEVKGLELLSIGDLKMFFVESD